MPRPPVTLLMPNRNNEPVLELTLSKLEEHTTYPSFELIVVDDGSEDDSLSILRRWRDSGRINSFTLIEREHGGVVEALNAGLDAAAGELVVQLDGDATQETTGWLERLVDFHTSDPRIGVVCPLVTYDWGDVNAAGVNMISELGLHDRGTTPLEPTGQRTVNTLVGRTTPEDTPGLDTPAEVDCAMGVCMLYSLEMARELGGYDHNFSPVWFDDLDLALSARRLGLKIFYEPTVNVVHRLSIRNAREPDSIVRNTRAKIRSAVATVTPKSVRQAVRKAEKRDSGLTPEQLRRFRHHRAYWLQKWGFDLLNPDMPALLERYGDTEICWAYDEGRRAAGEEILAAWSATNSA